MSVWNQKAKDFVELVSRIAVEGRDAAMTDDDEPRVGSPRRVAAKWFAMGAYTTAIPEELFTRWAVTDITGFEIPAVYESMLILLPNEFGYVLVVHDNGRVFAIYDYPNSPWQTAQCFNQEGLVEILQNPEMPVPTLTLGAGIQERAEYVLLERDHALVRVALLTLQALKNGDLARASVEPSGKQANVGIDRKNRNRHKAGKPKLPRAKAFLPEVKLYTFGKDLAARPKPDSELDEEILDYVRTGKHKYKNRFLVRGHFQQQVCGKAKDNPAGTNEPLWDRRVTYHEPYFSGLRDGPLLVRAELLDETSK